MNGIYISDHIFGGKFPQTPKVCAWITTRARLASVAYARQRQPRLLPSRLHVLVVVTDSEQSAYNPLITLAASAHSESRHLAMTSTSAQPPFPSSSSSTSHRRQRIKATSTTNLPSTLQSNHHHQHRPTNHMRSHSHSNPIPHRTQSMSRTISDEYGYSYEYTAHTQQQGNASRFLTSVKKSLHVSRSASTTKRKPHMLVSPIPQPFILLLTLLCLQYDEPVFPSKPSSQPRNVPVSQIPPPSIKEIMMGLHVSLYLHTALLHDHR